MSSRPARRIGQRSEALILLPMAFLTLVILSTYTLFSFRDTVTRLLAERQQEADEQARQVAKATTQQRVLPRQEALRSLVPQARGVAIRDARGTPLVISGEPWQLGVEDVEESGVVSGTSPARVNERELTVQVDLPAPILRAKARGLRVLLPVVLLANGALTLLVLFFLPRLLAPFDHLLERARHAGRAKPDSEDEVAFLLATFDKALEALTRPAVVDELVALERTLAQSFESGVLLLDATGTVLALNPIGAELLDLEPPAVGTPLEEVLASRAELRELVAETVERGEGVRRRELTVAVEDGGQGTRRLGVTVHPLRREDGRLRGFLVLFVDLTAVHREAEERNLADSLTQIGELAAGVAHEMRNSLATLRGYLALIEREDDREAIADDLREIRRESDHLQRVLEDFLSFARPGSVHLETIDLGRLAQRAAMDPALGGMAVRVELPGLAEGKVPEVTVKGDSQLLERALRNLLHNAVEAQRSQGTEEAITLRLRARAEEVEIEIEDRGPGLPPGLEARLFEPFVSERPGGVGLGLALTRRILLLHRGAIALETRPTGGTRVLITLPRGNSATESNGAAAEGTLRAS